MIFVYKLSAMLKNNFLVVVFYIIAFAVFLISLSANAQTTVTYAPTNSGSSIVYTNPICRDKLGVGAVPANYSVSEYIFTKSELNGVGFNTSGDITTIAFYKNNQNSTTATCPNVKIYMKNTSASTLSTGFWSTSGYTLVFSGTYDHGSNTQTGWRPVTLTTPFTWDNVNNLQILITNESGAAIGSGGSDGPSWRFTLFSGGDTRCRFNTDQSVLPDYISATGNRANIRLTYVAPCVTPSITIHPNTSAASTCQNGTAFPALSVTATGSTPLSYQWYSNTVASNSGGTLIAGATSASYTPSNATVGTLYYYCIVTNSCGSATTNVSGARTVHPRPGLFSVTGGGTYCSGAGGLAVGLNGSEGSVNYTLYLGGVTTGNTVAGTGGSISFGNQTSAGTYSVIATNSNGCTATMTGSVSITVQNPPSITSNPSTASASTCINGTGFTSISVSATGTATLTYQWYCNTTASNSGGSLISGATSSSYTPPNNVAGTMYYYCVVTNMCGTATSNVSGPRIVNPLPDAYSINGGGAYCSGGSGAAVGVNNSQSGVNYTLYLNGVSTGSTAGGTGGAISFGNQTTAGTYTVVATSSASCTSSMSGSAVITINPTPAAQNVTGGGTYCSGGSGMAVGTSGSESGVNYTLYLNGVTTGTTLPGTGSALSFGNQTAAGTYTVVAVNGTTSCTANMTGSVSVNITALPNVYEVSGGGTFCSGAVGAQVGMNNSQAGVTYTLYLDGVSTGQTLSGTGSAISFGNQTAAGTYTIIGSLGGSCTETMAGSATIIVKPLPQIFNAGGGGSYCAGTGGQSLTLDGSEPGTSYELYIDGSPSGNTQMGTGNALSWSGLTISGNYSIHATGSNLCESDMNGTIAIGIFSLPNIDTVATTPNTSCTGNNGEISITISGGTAPYTYSVDGTNYVSGNSFTGLAAGPVTIYVLDNNGCATSQSVTITDQSGFAIDSILTVNLLCNGDMTGEITIYAINGNQYSIDNGTTLQTGNLFSGLAAGTYQVFASDDLGCYAATTVTITEPATLSNSFNVSHVTCNGLSNGTSTASPLGGTSPYTFIWSDSLSTTSALVSNLDAGICYYVTITDDNNCQLTDSIMIDEPAVLQAIFDTEVNITCNGGSDGVLIVEADGGTPSYSYQWDQGISSVTEVATGLSAGITYSVTITDANGCFVSISEELSEPDTLEIVMSSQDPTCGNSNGTASVTASGGVGPYSYLWSNTASTQNVSNLTAGTYTVTISDTHGCTLTHQVTLSDNGAVSITSANITGTNCYGDSTGTAVLNISGGNPSYTILLSNGDSITTSSASASFTGLPSAVYNYSLTDAMGCTTTGTFTVTEPSAAVTANTAVQDVSCFNEGDGTIVVNASGGTPTYSYIWSGGQTTATLINLQAGTYFVTVADANGCLFASDSIVIMQPELLRVNLTGNNPSCGGYSDGSAIAAADGGTPPYTYAWSNMTSAETASGLTAGNYTVTITDAHGCTYSAPVTISEPAPVVVTGETGTNPDFTGYINTDVNGGSLPYTFNWSNGAVTPDLNSIGASGTYTLTVTDGMQCVYTFSFELLLDIIIPNVITPNADGKNDDFFITNIEGYEKITVEIFNRWGTRLFVFSGSGAEYSTPGKRFDGTYEGKNLPMGSYVYIIVLNDEDVHTGALLVKF